MLTKEISEVEKEILKEAIMKVLDSEEYKLFNKIFPTIMKTHIKLRDDAIKSAQQKFNEELETIRVNAYTSGYSSATKKEKAKFDMFIDKVNFIFDEIEMNFNGEEHSSMPLHLSDLKDYRRQLDKLSQREGDEE